MAKRHVIEPFELRDQERIAFWDECLLVARALSLLFQPMKMNYEIHGNTIPHLHMHLYPRFVGDPYQGGPITGATRFHRSRQQLGTMAEAIRQLRNRPHPY